MKKETGKRESLRCIWYYIPNKKEETLMPLIERHLLSAKSTVFTDAMKSYQGLVDKCRHEWVNHSIEFKTRAGIHTNNAESPSRASSDAHCGRSAAVGSSCCTGRRSVHCSSPNAGRTGTRVLSGWQQR